MTLNDPPFAFMASLNRLLDGPRRRLAELAEDEASWRRARRRALMIILGIGVVLMIHTVLIYSPRYLVGALYHGRNLGVKAVHDMPPERRDKILERLHGLYYLYSGGEAPAGPPPRYHVPETGDEVTPEKSSGHASGHETSGK